MIAFEYDNYLQCSCFSLVELFVKNYQVNDPDLLDSKLFCDFALSPK